MKTLVTIAALVLLVTGCAQQARTDGSVAQGGLGMTAATGSGGDGFGPDHNLHVGDSLPGRYRTRQYVIDKWSQHGLTRPPVGYHWVQAGADYLLVSGETGVIENTVRGK
jgi:hypothetical protein